MTRPALTCRSHYRFVGRYPHEMNGQDFYMWERRVRGDSRVEQITCAVDWFWKAGRK